MKNAITLFLEALSRANISFSVIKKEPNGSLKLSVNPGDFKKTAKLLRETFPDYTELEHTRLNNKEYIESVELEIGDIEITIYSKKNLASDSTPITLSKNTESQTKATESSKKSSNFWSKLGKMVKEAVDCCIE
ncbi:hypothetical protein JW962_02035 [Candidatus Dojkabacteria bacterium]|nr:hypothetical protein [Candidatus Dojkabacteria bacterium]